MGDKQGEEKEYRISNKEYRISKEIGQPRGVAPTKEALRQRPIPQKALVQMCALLRQSV